MSRREHQTKGDNFFKGDNQNFPDFVRFLVDIQENLMEIKEDSIFLKHLTVGCYAIMNLTKLITIASY